MDKKYEKSKFTKIYRTLFSLVALIAGIITCSPAEASRYYDEAEKDTLSVSDCDTVNNPTCKTFYIDGVNGDDTWDGLAPDFVSGTNGPFKTIGKALDRYSTRMRGGNVFKIKAGKYYEKVSVSNVINNISGDSQLVIGPYGDGEVIVDASQTNTLNWSAYDSNIYVTDYNLTAKINGQTVAATPWNLVMDDNFKQCRPVYSLGEVVSYCQWYWDSATRKLYVYTSGESPVSHDVIVQKFDPDSVEYGVYVPEEPYIKIYGLTIRGAGSLGISIYGSNSDYVVIEKCTVKYNGKTGAVISGDWGQAVKNHIHGNMMQDWPRGRYHGSTGGWGQGLTIASYSSVSGNIIHDNGGEGTGSMADLGHNIWQDNIVYDNYSANIYPDNQPNDIIRRNFSYSNTPNASDAVDADKVPLGSSLDSIVGKLRPYGIMIGDETASGSIATSANHQIYENVISGARFGINYYGQASGAGMKNWLVANNTIIMPSSDATYGDFVGLYIPYSGGNNTGTIIKNNIIYGSASDSSTVQLTGGTSETGVTLDNNLYYAPNNATPFWINSYPSTQKLDFSSWKSVLAGLNPDANSIYGEPLLVDATQLALDGAKIQSGSPAINSGFDLSSYNFILDSFKNVISSTLPMDIGAHEYGATAVSEEIAPVISDLAPVGKLAYDTAMTTISVSTNEDAVCKYSTVTGNSFEMMTGTFSTTGGISHSQLLSGLTNGSSYVYYVRCQDQNGNSNTEDSMISFSVASSIDIAPPVILSKAPNGQLSSNVTSTELSLITDENSTCKYSVTAGVAYSSMASTFSNTGGLVHSTTVSGLSGGNTYNYYVRCEDESENPNISDTTISFSVATASTDYQQTLYWSADSNNVNQTINGTTISAVGTPTYVTGYDGTLNGARNLAISNNYIQLSKTADFSWQAGKISFYFKPTNDVSNDILTFQFGASKGLRFYSSSSSAYSIRLDTDAGYINNNFTGDSLPYNPTTASGNWYKVDIEWNLSSKTLVCAVEGHAMNNQYSTSGSVWAITPADEKLYLGRGISYTTYNRSYVDEVYFYLPQADIAGPVISSLGTSSITNTGALISWETDEAATSQVEYGLTTSYGSQLPKDDSLVNEHAQSLVGLAEGTTYHYRVISGDSSGNYTTSDDQTFTTSGSDITAPIITSFDVSSTSDSLTVPVTAFTATDDVSVTGYILTESAATPEVDNESWQETIPTEYVFATEGVKTLYAWVKDAAGNVSDTLDDTVTIVLPTYTIGGAISGLTGTVILQNNNEDDLSVFANGSFIFATAILSGDSYDVAVLTQPENQTCAVSNGSGVVSDGNIIDVTIACENGADLDAPVISAFTLPATSSSLVISITEIIANDNVGIIGYKVTETTEIPSITDPGWTGAPPTSYAFSSAGNKVLYAWAKDAAGNVSQSLSASVVVTLVVSDDIEEDEEQDYDKLDIFKVKYSVINKNQIKISFKTNNSAKGTVRFGTDKNLKRKEEERRSREKHTINIKNLTAGTKYYFRISAKDKHDQTERTKTYSVTLPTLATIKNGTPVAKLRTESDKYIEKPKVPVSSASQNQGNQNSEPQNYNQSQTDKDTDTTRANNSPVSQYQFEKKVFKWWNPLTWL